MIDIAGRTVVFIGRLERLPRRLVGRGSCALLAGQRLQAKLAAARRLGAVCLGESEFLRGLELLPALPAQGRTLTLEDLARASGLDPDTLQLLVLLEIIEGEDGRFAFASLGIARSAARLRSEGAPLEAICSGLLAAAHGQRQTAAALVRRADGTIGVREGEQVADLSGQLRLPLPEPDSPSTDDLFEAAELAEEGGDLARAEQLYRRCVDRDRTDPGGAFNLANLLHTQGGHGEAKIFFRLATQIDPSK